MILHWLGPMFDPALEGYWGASDLDAATDTFLDVIAAHPDKVDGIKVSSSTPGARSTCAAACRRASAATPATTSTTPS